MKKSNVMEKMVFATFVVFLRFSLIDRKEIVYADTIKISKHHKSRGKCFIGSVKYNDK